MMRINHSKISYFALFLFSMLLSACGGGGSGGGTPPPPAPAAKTLTSIALTPATATVAKGLNTHFTATGMYSDATTADITSQVLWVSGNTAVATINSATAIATGVAVGNTTIAASLNGISSPAVNLTVTAAVITVIAINPASASVGAGLISNFTATGTYSDSTTANVTNQVIWTSGNTAVATINSITGVATGVAVGSTTIAASANGITSPVASLSVTAAVLTGISISPLAPSTPKGKSVTFTATGTYSDGTTGNVSGAVIWTPSNTAVSTMNTSGIASSLAQGSSTITASLNGVTANTTLTVTAPALASLSITPLSANAYVGTTQQFSASGTLTDGTAATLGALTWTSGNTPVASINGTGLATALTAGTTNISASSGGITSSVAALTTHVGSFTATANMMAGRMFHTVTLLSNGKVLLTGGLAVGGLSSAEIYDPVTGNFTATGNMTTGRYYHTATLLPNGKVLVVGGGGILASAELYDPATGLFTVTGSPLTAMKYYHAATLLPNGKVLITGGVGVGVVLASAELYDPATGLFTATGSMTSQRMLHTATLLPNGKVLVTGGLLVSGLGAIASAELYDPTTGVFTPTGSMATPRRYHTVTLLLNGSVLIAGGEDTVVSLVNAEVFQ